ncbi:MAG TPA: hypothetical protein VME46_24670 [Acidimicrobiales bacterium]|nr:hypothetical protein [Acidimicrobiales bacterium]
MAGNDPFDQDAQLGLRRGLLAREKWEVGRSVVKQGYKTPVPVT